MSRSLDDFFTHPSESNSNGAQTSRQSEGSSSEKTSSSQRDFTPSDTPDFEPTLVETNWRENLRELEKIRVTYNTRRLALTPVLVDQPDNSIREVMASFLCSAREAAKQGSRVVRLGLNSDQEKLQALITSKEARDEALAFISREWGISPDRVAFFKWTGVQQASHPIFDSLWMDIDFG